MHGVSYPDQMRYIAKLFGGPNPMWKVKSIFADFTGCGMPVIQTLKSEYGLTNLTGIVFNGSDKFTNSGMNMKNIMFAEIKNAIDNSLFKYPKEDNVLKVALDKKGFYHKMISEWADLEYEVRNSLNKRIEAPTSAHDDVCCSDALANFAAIHGNGAKMPKPSRARMFNLR